MKVSRNKIPDELFSKALNLLPIAVVDVVIFNKDKTRTLLFKRLNKPAKGVFYSLGGRIFKNEKFKDCAVRQVKREIGIKIKKEDLFGGNMHEDIHNSSIYKNVSYHAVVACFGCVIDEGVKIKLDSQHNVAKWFSVKDKSIYPRVKERIQKLLNE